MLIILIKKKTIHRSDGISYSGDKKRILVI